jgi:hypothetical protein
VFKAKLEIKINGATFMLGVSHGFAWNWEKRMKQGAETELCNICILVVAR